MTLSINISDSTSKIIQMLNLFNINFNGNKNKFVSLAYRCKNGVAVLGKFDANGVFMVSFMKNLFVYKVFTLMFVDRKQSTLTQ